jgi:hypothetical protein
MSVFPPFAGPAAEGDIQRAEQLLGLKLSGSYRTFVRLLGEQNDFGICGVDKSHGAEAGTVWVTRILRDYYGLPRHYLAAWQNEGADEALVLDTSVETSPGEHPVYGMYLPNWQTSMERAFDSFLEFFERAFHLQRSPRRAKNDAAPRPARKKATAIKTARTKSASEKAAPTKARATKARPAKAGRKKVKKPKPQPAKAKHKRITRTRTKVQKVSKKRVVRPPKDRKKSRRR